MVASTANTESFEFTTTSEHEVRITRLFGAPPELVFAAMTRPEHVKRWWGRLGAGYSVPVCEIDLRPGGLWRFVNRHPDGVAAFHGEYQEVEAPGRLVYTEIFEPFPDSVSRVTTTLTREGERTRLTSVLRYPTQVVRDLVLATGMIRGAGISYDRLEDVLAEMQRS